MTRGLIASPEAYLARYGEAGEPVVEGWLAAFGDETLLELVDEALRHNYDLYRAAAVREQVRAAVRLARSSLIPRLDGLGTLERDQDSRGSEELLLLELEVSWELDLWGRLRAGTLAAEQDLISAGLEYEGLRRSLAALVAETWFTAIAARMQIEIERERVRWEAATAAVASRRAEAGADTPLDYDFAEANLALARDALAEAEGVYLEVVRSLELLLGRYPSGELAAAMALPPVPETPASGVPAELVDRRPDLLAAEARVASAFHRRQASRLARLPRVRLTGAAGSEFSPARDVWRLAADMFAPLFAGGEIDAQIEIATAQQKAALALYVESVLRAFNEVETSMSNQRYLSRRGRALAIAVERLTSANETAEARYEAGVLTIFELNQVRQNYFQAQGREVAVRLEHLRQRIGLHLALGGSFEEREGPPRREEVELGEVRALEAPGTEADDE